MIVLPRVDGARLTQPAPRVPPATPDAEFGAGAPDLPTLPCAKPVTDSRFAYPHPLSIRGVKGRGKDAMLFPNEIQSALLFDRPVRELEAIVKAFLRVEE